MVSDLQTHRCSNLEPAQDNALSSNSSNSSVSESSALRSTPTASRPSDKQSSISSVDALDLPSNSSSDATNTSDSSSSESEDEVSSEENEDVVTIGGPRKPTIKAPDLSEAQDLRSRLAAFLPQMQKANAALGKDAQNIEDVEDDEPHIEMDLGLGVLEEEDSGRSKNSGSDEDRYSESNATPQVTGKKAGLNEHVMDDLQVRPPVSKGETLIKEVG